MRFQKYFDPQRSINFITGSFDKYLKMLLKPVCIETSFQVLASTKALSFYMSQIELNLVRLQKFFCRHKNWITFLSGTFYFIYDILRDMRLFIQDIFKF